MRKNADIERLAHALECPSDPRIARYPLGTRNLIYQCWVNLLLAKLPDPSVVNLLGHRQDQGHGSIYIRPEECGDGEEDHIGEPHDPMFLDSLTAEEIATFYTSIEASRLDRVEASCDPDGMRVGERFGVKMDEGQAPVPPRSPAGLWIDDEFSRLSRWIQVLKIVDGKQRDKHWPPPHIKTREQLLDLSLKAPTVGWLYPGSDHEELRRVALAALAAHFFNALRDKPVKHADRDRALAFLETWEALFERGTFRLGVTHTSPMGMWNGADTRVVVYDFDPSSCQFHCFPVVSLPDVRESFLEGQLDL